MQNDNAKFKIVKEFVRQNWFRVILLFGIILSLPVLSLAFVQEYQYHAHEPAGFFSGIWHGLLAPYSLVVRWFISDVVMYAVPNTGWFYDTGFLVGITGLIPIGWLAAVIPIIGYIFL